jgi:hypothetical protein
MDDYPEKQYLKGAQERMLDREIEEEVAKQLRERADKAIAKENEETKAEKPVRKATKKRGKRVATKTTKSSKSSRTSSKG